MENRNRGKLRAVFARGAKIVLKTVGSCCFISYILNEEEGKKERGEINNNINKIIIGYINSSNNKIVTFMKNKELYQEKVNRLESQIKKIEYNVATLNRDQAYVELDKAREILRDMQTMLNREQEYFKS